MTNEQAITVLKKYMFLNEDDEIYTEAIEKAIKVLENVEPHYISDLPDDDVKTLQTLAIDYSDGIAIFERKRSQGKWIPVSERLPEDMQRVLIWFEYYRYGDFNCMYQTYGFGYVCDGKWSSFINGETGWQDSRIIAWQPLPESYKEGSGQ